MLNMCIVKAGAPLVYRSSNTDQAIQIKQYRSSSTDHVVLIKQYHSSSSAGTDKCYSQACGFNHLPTCVALEQTNFDLFLQKL